LHNYLDAGFFRSTGVDTMLRSTSGRLWLTETGGIVRLTFDDGDVFPYDEKRAADSLEWLYGLTATRPRIERMYLYQWRGTADNHWDSGLLGLNGKPRPSYRVVEEHVARRGGSRPVRHARGTRTATLRFGRRLRFFADGRLEIRARCITRGAGVRRCRQHLLIRVAGRVVARLAADVAPRRAFVRTVRLAGSPRSSLVRGRPGRVGLQTCAWIGHACAGRVTVSVTTPLRPRRSRVAWMSSRRLDRTAG
jgi:hypothetical protein